MSYQISAETCIGHVHLKVSNLDRAVAFYRDVLGFDVTHRIANSAAFLSAGGYHHHIALNTWESLDGTAPAKNHTGLYHFAILVPDRISLARALQQLHLNGVTIDGAADHAVSEVIYFRDLDSNGIEIYCDRPQHEWPRDTNGELSMTTRALDLDGLLAELI